MSKLKISKVFLIILILVIITLNYQNKNVFSSDLYNSLDFQNTIIIKVGSSKAYFDYVEYPLVKNNSSLVAIAKGTDILVPLEFFQDHLECRLNWPKNSMSGTMSFGNRSITLTLNSNEIRINNIKYKLNAYVEKIYNSIYIPFRGVTEKLTSKSFYVRDNIMIICEKDRKFNLNDNNLYYKLVALFKYNERVPYMIYYGKLNDKVVAMAKTYKVVILHPYNANLTRAMVKDIQMGLNKNDPSDDVKVLGYISVGEDLRTTMLTDDEMLRDKRFTGDGTGPRVDPRGILPDGGSTLEGLDIKGVASKGGSGYASWYLDDNNFDGKPDRNGYFKGAFVNAGDPKWFETLDRMSIDGVDKIPGLAEILTTNYGRGLGCDGVFLDTIDTCAPNSYTNNSSGNQSEFEWTAPGFYNFIKRVREKYSNKIIVQNRGLFFFNPSLPQYKFCTREYINYLLFESYRLNSSSTEDYNQAFFSDNKFNYMPKIMAEAGRPDGFGVFSLGYAEGPVQKMNKETLLGNSKTGFDSLIEDIRETQNIAGFRHYITDGGITLVNSFVVKYSQKIDKEAPKWESTYNDHTAIWPPEKATQRIGIQEVIEGNGEVIVRWDIALDMNKVKYVLYYQTEPFDFKNDTKFSKADRKVLVPDIGEGYKTRLDSKTYPYESIVNHLKPGKQYYFLIRAVDCMGNEDNNEIVLSAVPH